MSEVFHNKYNRLADLKLSIYQARHFRRDPLDRVIPGFLTEFIDNQLAPVEQRICAAASACSAIGDKFVPETTRPMAAAIVMSRIWVNAARLSILDKGIPQSSVVVSEVYDTANNMYRPNLEGFVILTALTFVRNYLNTLAVTGSSLSSADHRLLYDICHSSSRIIGMRPIETGAQQALVKSCYSVFDELDAAYLKGEFL